MSHYLIVTSHKIHAVIFYPKAFDLMSFSPQYHRLNALMEMFGDLNFSVLGFSCNQFGLQSPGRYTVTLERDSK